MKQTESNTDASIGAIEENKNISDYADLFYYVVISFNACNHCHGYELDGTGFPSFQEIIFQDFS